MTTYRDQFWLGVLGVVAGFVMGAATVVSQGDADQGGQAFNTLSSTWLEQPERF
ncbi:hypothetical protein [Salinisphaera sp. PC39]|uniref:hypothetical protein n=1 Tax=Salinisphaera sp. PC39 TaxID=1304156 RepID=UPI0033406A16